MTDQTPAPSRRSLLSMIGVMAGSAAMYHAMTELGYAEGSTFTGPNSLSPVATARADITPKIELPRPSRRRLSSGRVTRSE